MIEIVDSGIALINRAGAIHWNFASAMFLQTAALVAVLCVLDCFLSRRVRPVVRYWMWSLVLLKLMLPVTLHTPASIAYWLVPEWTAPVTAATESIVEAQPPRSPHLSALRDVGLVPIGSSNETRTVDRHSSVPLESRAKADEPAQAPATVAVTIPQQRPSLTGNGGLFIAWLSGAMVLAAIVIHRAVRVWRLVQRATEGPRELADSLRAACDVLDLRPRPRPRPRRVLLKISDEVGSPAICGFWRPTILVPRRLLNQLELEQFQLIFVHELSHWKRWDLQVNLLQTVLQVIYFYNPALWLANAVIRRLREEAVDDAVLVALAAPVERYSNTLLDVAANALRPAELNVRLVGILESRKALVSRIRRLAARPLPKSARLGLWGLAAVVLMAVVLLPMAGGRRVVAEPADKLSTKTAAEPRSGNPVATSAPALSGHITDENGKPVADAQIRLIHIPTGIVQQTGTSKDGRYGVDRPWNTGEHRLMISSDRCLGLTDFNACPRVVLDSRHPIVRNFSLKLACQVHVQTLDEEGHPIQGVAFFRSGPDDYHHKETDREGWTTIGGLTAGEYVFAAASNAYALERLSVRFDASHVASVAERKLVLRKGIAVKGTVVCSDGKPAAGSRMSALPSWWGFNGSPLGAVVAKDGSFVLPHIVPGAYNVSVDTPGGENWRLLSDADLYHQSAPLALRADFLSPAARAAIRGHFRFLGGRPQRRTWIICADSLDGKRLRHYGSHQERGDMFEIDGLPRGRYRLLFDSPEIETKRIDSVAAPTDDLEVEIQVRGPIRLRGTVSTAGAKGPQPINDFRIRLIKVENLRGTNFTPPETWRTVFDPQGAFSAEVPGPGNYVVEATADGFATTRSEPINTDHLPKTGIRVTLSKGAGITGTVRDEEGRPIDGAVVISLAKAGEAPPLFPDQNTGGLGVRTVNGRFAFDGLNPGRDSFRISHPDYALTEVRNVELGADAQAVLAIVMKRGGTVDGHVQDEHGRLLSGVKLRFQRYPHTFAGDHSDGGRFATAVTDRNGYYEVRHLPEELIHVLRESGTRSLGVWHLAVLPLNGRTRTIDFGGPSTVSGRLFVNGEARSNTKLLLADEDSPGDDFGATAMTDHEGSFTFSGISQGKRYLYFSIRRGPGGWDEWCRVRPLEIHSAARNFGRVEHRTGTVTVKVIGPAGQPDDRASVYLNDYDPSPFRVKIAARPQFPRAEGSFVFEHVGPGKYDVQLSGDGKPRVMQVLVISPDNPNRTLTLKWPTGTASIRGTIDRTLRELMGQGFIELYSPEVRWLQTVKVQADGRFELAGIPPGPYSLTMVRYRSGVIPVLLCEIRLADGEAKTLDISSEKVPQAELSKGVLKVSVFSPQGIPLPGSEVHLTGVNGLLKPTKSDAGHFAFAVAPGTYRLSAAFLGAETVTHVEIKPSSKGGGWGAEDRELNVTLAPVD